MPLSPLHFDTSKDEMEYPGVTFLSHASWHAITLFSNNRKVILIQHRRTVPLCSSRETWSSLLKEAGFQADILEVPYYEQGIDSLDIIYAKK